MEIDMRIFHKVTVAYPVTTDMVTERTFSFSTPDDARLFRGMAENQGYKIILHSFDQMRLQKLSKTLFSPTIN
jgi:hypothetical protein